MGPIATTSGEPTAPPGNRYDPVGNDPLAAIRAINALASPESSALLVLVNFHRFINSPEVIQAIPALANVFFIGLGQLIQGRLLQAFFFFMMSVSSGVACLIGIGFIMLPIVWVWSILDAARYVPPRPH